jgi:hypothetical protein
MQGQKITPHPPTEAGATGLTGTPAKVVCCQVFQPSYDI